jgi:sterol desaturase/sphingolipid hydroxylase (fatty acid hydroxylase superfamily)
MSTNARSADDLILLLGPIALIWGGVFASHLVRCVLACGLTELAVARVPALRAARLRDFAPDNAQRRREFRASVHTGAIFHDAYFYWTHRFMHRRSVFKVVHLEHHRSHYPTAWTAFSFSPLEAIVEGSIHLLLAMVIPLHASVLGAFIVWTNVYGALLHCGCDVFFVRGAGAASWRARWLNGPVEHEAHHNGCDGNFALYFSLWDRVMGTRRVTLPVPDTMLATTQGTSP